MTPNHMLFKIIPTIASYVLLLALILVWNVMIFPEKPKIFEIRQFACTGIEGFTFDYLANKCKL